MGQNFTSRQDVLTFPVTTHGLFGAGAKALAQTSLFRHSTLISLARQFRDNSRMNLFLWTIISSFFFLWSGLLLAQDNKDSNARSERQVKIIEPDKQVAIAQPAAIDTEKFELGMNVGFLAVEDFNSNPIIGLALVYHLTDNWIATANYGISNVSRATFEELAGGNFLSDYHFETVSLGAGYKLLSGRSFFGKRHKYNSSIYALLGIGNVDFADDNNVSLVAGASYRVVLTDWMTVNLDLKNHSVERDFLDDNKRTNNIEFTLGINALF